MSLYWVVLLAAIVTSMAGQTLLKAGAGRRISSRSCSIWRTIVGLVLYGGAAMLYIVALRRIPMSVALPCTAISYVAAVLIGHYAFDEPMPAMRVRRSGDRGRGGNAGLA